MVSNSNNIINKTTSHLKLLNTKRPLHMPMEIQVLAWDKHKKWQG